MNRFLSIAIPLFLLHLISCNSSDFKVSPKAEKGILDLRTWNLENESILKLKGEWSFYWEELLEQKDLVDENITLEPHYIQVPGIWNDFIIDDEKLPGYGFSTYHLKILINESFDKVMLRILSIQTASKISVNGEILGIAGLVGKDKKRTIPGYKPMTIPITHNSEEIDILIQVSNFDHRQGGIWGSIFIGHEKEIVGIWRYERDRDFFILGAIIIMALYHLGLFFIHKQEREAIFFSLFCIVISIRLITTGDIFILNLFPNISWKVLICMEYISFFVAVPLFLMFIYSLFYNKILKYFIIALWLISLTFSLITVIGPVALSSTLIPSFQIITLLAGLYVIYDLIRFSLRKEHQALVILIGFLTMFTSAINDILYANDTIHSVYLISYGFLLFIIFQSTVLTMRFAISFKEVERQKKQLSKTNNEYRHEINERTKLEEDLIISHQNNSKARLAIIMGLAKLAEYRDTDTGSHIERIQEFNSILAKQLQSHLKYSDYISDEYIDDLHVSSILHDIGKVGIPDAILQKPGKLTTKEFEIMKRHSIIGGDSIKVVENKTGVRSFLTLAKEIAYMHHERWDGSGYPRGIKEHDIPLSARLTALVDVYDALTSKRCYKEAYTHEKAKEIILEGQGSHFDPDVVDAFMEIENKFDNIRMVMQDETIMEL